MAERNNSDGFSKSRAVLGDLTNRLGKRGFSEREKNGIKSFNFNDIDFAKRIRVSPNPSTETNSSKGNISNSSNENRDDNVMQFDRSSVSKSSNDVETNRIVIGTSKVHTGNKDMEILDVAGETAVSQEVEKLDVDKDLVDSRGEIGHFDGDALPNMNELASKTCKSPNLTDLEGERAMNFISTEADGDGLHNVKDFDADDSKASQEGSQSDINGFQLDGDDHNADNFVSSQCGSIDCTILPESQESRVFGVEKSTGGPTNAIKACSCSFCTKAIKKSRKEASILAERSIRSKSIEKHGVESFDRVSKLESDLMHQWRSLFQRTADIWEEEANQLEARLLPLTDLREKFKTDLELIDAARSEKH
ncbi:hypothetical protein DH2020_046265 [Rehmannia glutinosa]|uniref:Uncharacterized protein n=1 Tax=Rehmannia glutinosa TaxID=99300 RepID=A0ABR0UCX6_REHGL